MEQHNNNWNRYLEAVYEVFALDFLASMPAYPERRFALKRHPLLQEKEATFWHITSTGQVEAERPPDLRRCERIVWIRPMIEAIGTDRVHAWKNVRERSTRVLISLPDFSYLVVLDDREASGFIMLWTAYPVEHENQRARLRKEYEKYTKG
jgi:hypothetical protein